MSKQCLIKRWGTLFFGFFIIYGCFMPSQSPPPQKPPLSNGNIEKMGEGSNPLPKLIYTCNTPPCDDVNRAKKSAVGKGFVSADLGRYYFESPSEEYISTLFFNKDELQIRKLMKDGTGLLSPIYALDPETLLLFPDWDKTASLHNLLSGRLGLKLLPVNQSRIFYQIYTNSSWEDAIAGFTDKAVYLILSDNPSVAALATNKIGKLYGYANLYLFMGLRSEMIFIPFKSLDRMRNVELEFNPGYSSYCGIEAYEKDVTNESKDIFDEILEDPAIEEGINDCWGKYARQATKQEECFKANEEKNWKRFLKDFANKRTPWQEKIRQKERLDILKFEFCASAFKKWDIADNTLSNPDIQEISIEKKNEREKSISNLQTIDRQNTNESPAILQTGRQTALKSGSTESKAPSARVLESPRDTQTVNGINGWKGKISDKPVAPSSNFTKLKIGMSMYQVIALTDQPTDRITYSTWKAWIPFYRGSDRYRHELVYRGQGRLIFASRSDDYYSGYLISIIHNAQESGYR